MKLEDMTTGMMQEATDIYVAAAYKQSPLPLTVKGRILFLREHGPGELRETLSQELVERIISEEDPNVVDVYSLRLGNERYPHMKLSIRRQEGDDYLLVVETHDRHFEVESKDPDAPKAQELQAYNSRLKAEIEAGWREADLPAVEED